MAYARGQLKKQGALNIDRGAIPPVGESTKGAVHIDSARHGGNLPMQVHTSSRPGIEAREHWCLGSHINVHGYDALGYLQEGYFSYYFI